MNKKILLFCVGLAFIFSVCKDNPTNSNGEFQSINNWVRGQMALYYFWDDRIPSTAPGDTDPGVFFNSLLEPGDIFSYISDDADALFNDLNGSSVTAGYSPTFGRIGGTDDLFMIIEFVYPNTSAAEAGLKRGDIVLGIDGQQLTIRNYLDLFYEEGTDDLTMAELIYNEQDESYSLSVSGEIITVTKTELELDPTIYTNVYTYNDHKIGYIFYTRFLSGEENKFLTNLSNTLLDFKNQGVTDLVIDLRYNPGGGISTAESFANSIAPILNTQNNDVFVSFQYNEGFTQAFINEQGVDSPNLVSRFSEVETNLGLSKVYFLVTNSSASASELLINGLEPYMDVYSIGDNTFGKFYGSIPFSGQDAPTPNNYAIVPVVLKYANALGVTDFKDGLDPDFEATDDLLEPYQIGDVNDPLLKIAIEHITESVITSKATHIKKIDYTPVKDPIRLKKGNILFPKFKN